MEPFQTHDGATREDSRHRFRLVWLVLASALIVTLIVLLRTPRGVSRATVADATNEQQSVAGTDSAWSRISARASHRRGSVERASPADKIVADKVVQFTRSRREIVRTMARRFKFEVPADVERFFDLAEAGRWDELNALYESMRQRRQTTEPLPRELATLWPAMLETLGITESARDWPAQKLLDYGNAVLGSLRPGMIYIGGTDPGRFIPTLLNETADGERHIIVTQNALADQTYLDYVSFLYSDRFTALAKEDSERAFQDYLSDAQKRLQHDQQFPNEPKQIRPGEDLQMIDNRLQVSGQIAVMAINEKLLQTLMEKNPDASFAMEESFPFNSMFANASSLGPIMELRVRDEQNVLTRERAAQSVDYWRTTAQQIFADPEARESPEVLKSYSKLISSQGGLFANRNYTAEAEQAFRLAAEICPYSSEAVFRLANLLVGQNRIEDALPVAEAAVKADMNNQQQFRSLVEELNRLRKK
jgi:tetratricopeptide (TPR) repeat protein